MDVAVGLPPIVQQMALVVMLKSGPARGSHTVNITVEAPSGLTSPGPISTVLLEGEDRGVNIIVNANFVFPEEGVYWFNVLFEDRLMTRIPFRVVRAVMTTPPAAPGHPPGSGPALQGPSA